MEKPKYSFLMIDYETPKLITDIWNTLADEELYLNPEYPDDYGLERKTHVTVVPCLDNNVDIEALKKYLRPLYEYPLLLTNVSAFTNNQDYDVLKCDVASDILYSTNKRICADFPTFTEYKEYHPHMTIAYMKKGLTGKYHKDIVIPLVILHPKCFVFSNYDEEGNNRIVRFS